MHTQDKSQRETDINGFWMIKGNPISKVGVFEYLAREIDPSAPNPDEIVKVFRPQETLENQECIDSFKLKPIIDDHTFLGSGADGSTAPEEKGVEGVIGEDVYFDFPYLRGNLIIYSERLKDLIEEGKTELSPGYRCEYVKKSGTYEGVDYDYVQTRMIGNHLALVDEGRTGPDVCILDRKTIDSMEFIKMAKKRLAAKTQDNAVEELKALLPKMSSLFQEFLGEEAQEPEHQDDEDVPASDDDMDVKELAKQILPLLQKMVGDDDDTVTKQDGEEMPASDDDETACDDDTDTPASDEDETAEDDEEMPASDDDETACDDDDVKEAAAADAATIKRNLRRSILQDMAKRDALASRLSNEIGTFQYAAMDCAQVAAYGVKKLGLKCKKGQEQVALDAYFVGKRSVKPMNVSSDSKFILKDAQLSAYINKIKG